MESLTAEQIQQGMSQFTGSVNYYRHALDRRFLMTEGVNWLASNAGLFWLVDAIVSHQKQALRDASLKQMQFWTLRRKSDGSWVLVCERDTDDVAIQQEIDCSDCPLDEVRIWVALADVNQYVLMLPSEY